MIQPHEETWEMTVDPDDGVMVFVEAAGENGGELGSEGCCGRRAWPRSCSSDES